MYYYYAILLLSYTITILYHAILYQTVFGALAARGAGPGLCAEGPGRLEIDFSFNTKS